MSKKETKVTKDDTEVTESTVEAAETEASASNETASKSKAKMYIAAVVAVVVIILGVLYFLEKEDRSSTNIFGGIISSQEANKVVAVVNGKEIVNSQLNISIQQFGQAAAAQGVDITSPDAQAEIRTQALDVLVNTELLKQAAVEKGIVVTEEAASERLEGIKADIGGEEVLTERMQALGITNEQLESDVRDEIMIQELLNTIFAESNIAVTEEEISQVYENAGGADAGLPALDEVRPQIETQIKTSKEQEAVDKYLGELKSGAEIVIK